MDFLIVRFKLTHDTSAERSLLVKKYELDEDEEQAGKTLQVHNIPYFVSEDELSKIFAKSSQVEIQPTNRSGNMLQNKSALIHYDSTVKMEKELRLIKHSIEAAVLYDTSAELNKNMLSERCGLRLLDQYTTKYPDNLDEIREEVMEVMRVYNEEILAGQKKKKRRYEREDDGWVTVVRK